MCEEIDNTVNASSNYGSALNEGRCRQTNSTLPNEGTRMSLIEQLRARTEPMNVKDVANLLGVAESTVQRWVRDGEIPAIRISDTIRFDPGALAERLACFEISIVRTKKGTEGDGRADSSPAAPSEDEGR